MSRVLIVALALAALLAGALWLALSAGERGSTVKVVQASSDAASANAPATTALAPPTPALESTAVPDVEAPTSAVSAGREPLTDARAAELASAHWVEGHVVFPAGTPRDERLFVVADGRDFADGSDHRVAVEPDGTFRVAFSERTRKGWIQLEGRYLYLARRVGWSPASTDPVVLEPELGVRLLVKLVPPADASAAPRGRLALTLRRGDRNIDAVAPTRRASVRADLVGTFDALPPADVVVALDSEECVGSCTVDELEPGHTREVALELRPGIVLEGRVRGENGAPLAGVEVEGCSFGARITDFGRSRTRRTSASGAFRLGAFAAGEVRVCARLDGYEPATIVLGSLAEGTRRTDIEVVLGRGKAIAGVLRWADGSPAEGAVTLTRVRSSDEGGDPTDYRPPDFTCKSDARGRFRITGLDDASFRVDARARRTEVVRVVSEFTGVPYRKRKHTWWKAELAGVAAGTGDLVLTLEPDPDFTGSTLLNR